jgi:hypothetical protein
MMKLTARKKITYTLLISAIVIFLVGIMLHGYGKKGSQSITNRHQLPIYSWKSGSLRVTGPISPDSCGLTTPNCKCNLSAKNSECSFNFNLEGLNYNVAINTNKDKLALPSITYIKSQGCKYSKANRIYDCSITFRWNKVQSGSEAIKILLDGAKGVQSLINLQLNAQ